MLDLISQFWRNNQEKIEIIDTSEKLRKRIITIMTKLFVTFQAIFS